LRFLKIVSHLANTVAAAAAAVPQQIDRLRVELGCALYRPQSDRGLHDAVPAHHILRLERLANALLEREQRPVTGQLVVVQTHICDIPEQQARRIQRRSTLYNIYCIKEGML